MDILMQMQICLQHPLHKLCQRALANTLFVIPCNIQSISTTLDGARIIAQVEVDSRKIEPEKKVRRD